MNSFVKGSLGTIAALVVSEVLYKLYIYCRNGRVSSKNESRSKDAAEVTEVFFFPDKEVACRTHFLSETRCFKHNCKYSHGKTSLSELYRHLSSCRKTMDVCVFVITCEDLAGIVLSMHRRGVAVRVITDDEQENITGSQIWSFRKAGIPVRTDHSSTYMHNKFVLVDSQLLINGSFNWTRNAITGNQENVLVTNHHRVVTAFQAEFERLWQQFDPKNVYTSELSQRQKREENESCDQWEATMFWDNGNAFIDGKVMDLSSGPGVGTAYSYMNATLKTAYDFTNGRSFIGAFVLEISPLIPKPIIQVTNFLRDYKNGIEYQYDSSDCQKSKLDPIKRHCIPASAVALGAGSLGKNNSVSVSTYAYTLLDFPYQFQTTVTQKGCLPVHVAYLIPSVESGSGAINNQEVMDVMLGIRAPSIFHVAQQCKNVKMVKGNSKKSRWLELFL